MPQNFSYHGTLQIFNLLATFQTKLQSYHTE